MAGSRTKKAVAVALITILILNLILFALHIYDALLFWAVIIGVAIPAFTFLKRE